ncbi:MAG TPA: cell division protein ZapA [Deltaproteobacteria bacterium]|nr:cell division protein ZapA [Deltaproteobacteria bacterium]HOM30048.1 cell division protein ZapA [Deltaproteobacteria bacterium]HPP80918.1 cell division protein ZapA [Deltaproteobacteria bacterium]
MYETVTIQILGQEYRVRSGEEGDHVRSLSRYINEKVSDIQKSGKAVTTAELVAMTMLHMADDVAKARKELEILRETVSDRISRIIDRIAAASP